ncbi:MAG: rhodanese-like domain-containing protein [Acidobacteria bacterium]|nr:rhodanese-like domain-containing protein [Acidobacteriota bacterium]
MRRNFSRAESRHGEDRTVFDGEMKRMRNVGSLTALALACAAAIMLNAACKSGDDAEVVRAGADAPAQQAATPRSAPTPGDSIRRTTAAETQQALEKGTAIVVDVRPKAQYDQSHIKGSVSVPRDELTKRLSELPKDKLLIFYCA